MKLWCKIVSYTRLSSTVVLTELIIVRVLDGNIHSDIQGIQSNTQSLFFIVNFKLNLLSKLSNPFANANPPIVFIFSLKNYLFYYKLISIPENQYLFIT
jgi:hypothetical protein